jgi:hypothetical protein
MILQDRRKKGLSIVKIISNKISVLKYKINNFSTLYFIKLIFKINILPFLKDILIRLEIFLVNCFFLIVAIYNKYKSHLLNHKIIIPQIHTFIIISILLTINSLLLYFSIKCTFCIIKLILPIFNLNSTVIIIFKIYLIIFYLFYLKSMYYLIIILKENYNNILLYYKSYKKSK